MKLLRRGAGTRDAVRRFLRERQTLARLDHEYVARLLDGGTTEAGEPYLVMECVDGEAVDFFAVRLDLGERLELFVRIGRAVQHAHERGFVHRDLAKRPERRYRAAADLCEDSSTISRAAHPAQPAGPAHPSAARRTRNSGLSCGRSGPPRVPRIDMESGRGKRRRGWTDAQVLDLVREHERRVRSYLASLGCPADRVDDLAQETFLRLFTGPPRAEEEAGGLRATLCVAARNLYFNSLRDEASRPDLVRVERAWAEFERDDGGAAHLEALSGCLELLPLRTREVLRLRFGANASRTDIAARTSLSVGGVKALLLRAKETLRDCVRRKLDAESFDSLGVAR